jgi:hypothetical protein
MAAPSVAAVPPQRFARPEQEADGDLEHGPVRLAGETLVWRVADGRAVLGALGDP